MATAEVRDYRGVPTIFIDGRPFDGINYRSTELDFIRRRPKMDAGEQQESAIKSGFSILYGREAFTSRDHDNHTEAGRHGIHSHMVPTVVGHHYMRWDDEGWQAPDRFSFASMDTCLNGILDADPDAYLLPFAYLGAPMWWTRAHPGDIVLTMDEKNKVTPLHMGDDDEYIGDPASEAWRTDMAGALRTYIRHIRNQPYGRRVIGLHIGGGSCNEWFLSGLSYSSAARSGFHRWLGQRYGSVGNLNDAWGSNYKAIEQVELPNTAARNRLSYGGMRNPVRDRSAIDFERFFGDCVADCIGYFASVVKEETQRQWLVLTFHGYINELVRERLHDCGMLAIDKVLRNPDVDVITAPDVYLHRRVGEGYPSYMNQVESVKLHGKVWLAQNDYRTYMDPAVPTTAFWGRPDTEWDSIQQTRYIFLSDLTHGCPTQFHDQTGVRYAASALWKTLGQCAKAFRRSLEADRGGVDEIACVADPSGPFLYGRRHPLTDGVGPLQVRHLGRVGAPFGRYILEDLERIGPHKLWLFSHAVDLDEAAVSALHARMQREGSVAVWLHACGLVNGSSIAATNIRRLTGFEVAADVDGQPSRVTYVTGETVDHAGGPESAPLFYIPEQGGVEVLGRYDDGRCAAAMKRMDGWTSVYAAAPALPPGILRDLACRAGVHLYIEGDSAVFANRSFVGVMSPQAGARTVTLREPSAVYDVFEDRDIPAHGARFEATFRQNESKLFFLGDRKTWQKQGAFRS